MTFAQKWVDNVYYGYGDRHERGQMLLDYQQEHQLYRTNTLSDKQPQRKCMWITPDGKTKNQTSTLFLLEMTIERC